MKRQLPSQLLEERFLSPATRQAPRSGTIRLGAQLMLQKAVELEVTEFYVKGMSTRDIEAALTDALEVEGVSKSTVSVLCKQLHHDFERWQNRDSSSVDLLYLPMEVEAVLSWDSRP